MRLIYLNAELDATKEHELFNITPKGFKVEVTYTDESWRTKQGFKQEIFESRTEVHHLYKNPFEESIAFESDILADGSTRPIKEIESVIISLME